MKSPTDTADRQNVRPGMETQAHRAASADSIQGETLWWKQALRQVAFAALRLHHYRYLRTRMFHDALSRDGTSKSGCVSTCSEQSEYKH